jgi:hypothetical protein
LFASITETRMVFVRNGPPDMVRIHEALGVDRDVRDLVALLLQALARVEDGLVLDHGRDDVVALLLVELGDAFRARLSLSVAPDVNTISFRFWAPMRAATRSRE